MHYVTHDTDPELHTLDIVGDTVADARHLVRIEVELAKDELMRDARHIKLCAALAGSAVAFAMLGFAMLLVGLGFALGPTGAAIMTLVLFAISGTTGLVAFLRLPRKPFGDTLERIRADERLVRDGLS